MSCSFAGAGGGILGGKLLGWRTVCPLSGSHTLLGFYSSDKTMEFFRRSRSGMTFEPLSRKTVERLLTLFLADSHAKTSPQAKRRHQRRALRPVAGNGKDY